MLLSYNTMNTLGSVDQDTRADLLETNGSLPGVNGEKSRVVFHEPVIRSKPESASPPPGNNGSKARDLQNEPLIPPTPVVEPTPVIIDEELDCHDLRMSISVKVNGRSIKIMDSKFHRIVPDGARSQNRHVYFQTLASILDEVKLTVAIKTNSKLPIEPFRKDTKKDWDNNDFIPRDPGSTPQSLTVHTDPPVE